MENKPVKKMYPPAVSAPDVKAYSLIFWTTLFNIGYHTGTSPFRFKFNLETESWDFCTNKWQKILIRVLTFVYTFNYIVASIYYDYGRPTNPIFYYTVARTVVGILYFALYYVVWTKQELIRSIYVAVQTHHCSTRKIRISSSKNKPSLKNGTWFNILASIYFLQVCLYLMECVDWNFSKYFHAQEQFAVKVYFIKNPTNRMVTVPLGILLILMDLHYMFVCYSLELFFLATSLFLRSLITESVSEIEEISLQDSSVTGQCQVVIESYRRLKRLTCHINDVCGPVTLCFIFGSMVWVCEYLIELTTSSNPLNFIRTCLFVLYVALWLYVAADTHRLTGRIYKWLYIKGNYRGFSQTELLTLLHDLSLNDIGIGVESCFIVTFNFLGLMLGLVISYALIFYQLKALAAAQGANLE